MKKNLSNSGLSQVFNEKQQNHEEDFMWIQFIKYTSNN